MLDFEAELDKLLSCEADALPQYEFAELAAAAQVFLAELNKKQTDVSLQIEEIYDLVKEQDTRILQEAVNAERTRANHLVFAAISLSDLLEDFYAYARQSGSEELKHQAKLLWENAGGILSGRNIFRFGEEGQPLNPQIHTVKASVESPLSRERVVQVLQSGYMYQNALLRKAAVVISRGQADAVFKAETADAEMEDCGEDGINDADDADVAGLVDDEGDTGAVGDADGVDDEGDTGAVDDEGDTGAVGDADDTGDTGAVDDEGETGAVGDADDVDDEGYTGAVDDEDDTDDVDDEGYTGAVDDEGDTADTGDEGDADDVDDEGYTGAVDDEGDTGDVDDTGAGGDADDTDDEDDTGNEDKIEIRFNINSTNDGEKANE
jgi:molecular chaperone GrpE (heat shock protein)